MVTHNDIKNENDLIEAMGSSPTKEKKKSTATNFDEEDEGMFFSK